MNKLIAVALVAALLGAAVVALPATGAPSALAIAKKALRVAKGANARAKRADATAKAGPRVVQVDREVQVLPQQFADADLVCPGGYETVSVAAEAEVEASTTTARSLHPRASFATRG
jgi:hypothetical protein